MKSKLACFIFSMVFLTACSMTKPGPRLYPNEKLRSSQQSKVDADIAHCNALANQYLEEPETYKQAAKEGLTGAVIGAGAGAVGGAIFSNAGRGTAAGAAVGGIIGILNSLRSSNEQSPSYQRFVERCLQKEGYEVLDWT